MASAALKARDDGLSRSWVVSRRSGSAYTGGPLTLLPGRDAAACLCSDRVAVLSLKTGLVQAFIPGDVRNGPVEPIVAFVASPDGATLVTFSRNMMVRVWDLDQHLAKKSSNSSSAAAAAAAGASSSSSSSNGSSIREWKGHRLPVRVATFDPTSTLVASGGSDRTVFVWDAEKGHATHNFRGHEAVVTAVAFQPHPVTVQRLVSASEDGNVRVWDLVSNVCAASLSEHFSQVTALLFSPDANGHFLLTTGRDKIINVWDTREFGDGTSTKAGSSSSSSSTASLKATITTHEGIEAAVMFPTPTTTSGASSSSSSAAAVSGNTREMVFATAGDRGMLRKWKVTVSGGRADRKVAYSCIATRTAKGLRQGPLAAASAAEAAALATATGATSSASAAAGANAPSVEDAPLSSQFEHLLLRPHNDKKRSDDDGDSDGDSSSSEDEKQATGSKRNRKTASSAAATTTSVEAFDLIAVTRDQVLTLVSPRTLTSTKTITAFNDQITDVKYVPLPLPAPVASSSSSSSSGRSSAGNAAGEGDRRARHLLAVATNSEQLRIVDVDTFDTRICDGHSGIILSLSPSPDGTLVATASKDKTVRVWDVQTGICVAICEGHTESVGAVSFPSKASNFMRAAPGAQLVESSGAKGGKGGVASSSSSSSSAPLGNTAWVVSASKDRTLKVWQLAPLLSRLPSPRPSGWAEGKGGAADVILNREPYSARTSAATVAHEKDVNAVAVAPNDKMIATAGQDRVIKLWSAPDLAPIAALSGHKRGVWSVAFSPADQVLASASGDNTLRLWAVTPGAGFACLRTFEGHDASALCVRFLRNGSQLLSAGADGLVKVWSVKDAECLNTFDAHTDKVWALAVRPAEFNTKKDAIEDEADAGSNDDESEEDEMDEDDEAGGKKRGVGAAGSSSRPSNVPTYEVEMVTGGADSVLNVWRDATSSTAQGEVEAAEAALRKQQSLYNAMASRDYEGAIALTLELDQPGRCGDILQELLEVGPTPATISATPAALDARCRDAMLAELVEMDAAEKGVDLASAAASIAGGALFGDSAAASAAAQKAGAAGGLHPVGSKMLISILRQLTAAHLVTLLGYVREWNTQSRHGILAQQVLAIILRHTPRQKLLSILSDAREGKTGASGIGAKGVRKVIPGVGATHVKQAPGALDLEATLTPVAIPVSSLKEGEENNSNALLGMLASAPAATLPPSTAAAAELRALISSILPYSERHLERLDRVMVSTYAVDGTLHAMRALLPEEDSNITAELEERSRLLGEGVSGSATRRGPIAVTTVAASDDEEEEEEDSDEGEEDVRGKGWLRGATTARTAVAKTQLKPVNRANAAAGGGGGVRVARARSALVAVEAKEEQLDDEEEEEDEDQVVAAADDDEEGGDEEADVSAIMARIQSKAKQGGRR